MAERIVAMQQQKMVMEGALLSTIASAGYLLGFDTVEQCMKDEGMRAFLGHALLHEIMPLIPLQKADVDQLAMEICGEMEKPAIAQPLLTIMQNGVRAWEKQALPLLEKFESREGILPACLCMGLSVLIMYFSGAKKNAQGAFEGLRAGEAYIAEEDEDVLLAFSRLSPDMPPETLSYAVLSDRDIWEKDLREIDGLTDLITDQIRDLQLLGLRAAMEKCCQKDDI